MNKIELTKKITLDPNNDSLYLKRGYTYFWEMRNDEAIKDFTKSLELNPNNADSLVARAFAYNAIHKYSEAINDFTNAIRLNSQFYDYYKFRGLSYFYSGRFKISKEKLDSVSYDLSRAIRDFNRAVKLNPEDAKEVTLLLADVYNYCGLYYKSKAINMVLECSNNDDNYTFYFIKAIKFFTKAINIDLKNANFYSERAYCYMEIPDYKKAIDDYTMVIELDHKVTQDSLAYYARSHCYYRIKKYDQSLDDMINSKKFFDKELELLISKNGRKKSKLITESPHTMFFINFFRELDCSNVFFLKSLEILFELKKYDFYNESYLKQAELYDIRSNNEFLILMKLSLLESIAKGFIEEVFCLPQEKYTEKTFNNYASFMLIFFKIHSELKLQYIANLRRIEKEKAQAKIDERNKVIADLSHSIKNLIGSVIDPLENLKTEVTNKQPIIDSAIKGANLVREIVNAMSLSYKGSIDDFRYDARNTSGQDRQDVKIMILESLKSSVGNMYDGKYFSAFQEGYFQLKQSFINAKSDWDISVSQSKNLKEISCFLKTHFFEPFIEIAQIENFIIGNERGSAVKLLILFGELILNAVKYSAFVKREDRFVKIEITHNPKEFSILVENRYSPRKKIKTTGLGNVIITNFAKLLNTSPVINRENDIYSIKITFENFWQKGSSV